MILNSIQSFKGVSFQRDNNTQVISDKKPVFKDDTKTLLVTLSCLAAATAIGIGVYRSVKKGKVPKQGIKPDVKPDVPISPKGTPSSATVSGANGANNVVNPKTTTKPEQKVKVKEEAPQEVVLSAFSKENYASIVEVVSEKLKDLSLLSQTVKAEADCIDKMIISAKKLKNSEILNPLSDIKLITLNIGTIIESVSNKMKQLQALGEKSIPDSQKAKEYERLQADIHAEVTKLAQLRNKASALIKAVSPKMAELLNKQK